MTKNHEVMTIVEKLRPGTVVDDRWPASARDAALERLLTAAADSPPDRSRRPRSRRVLLIAVLTAGLVSSGAGIATAGGLLPESFTGSLSFWTNETDGAVEVQTARRVAQGPGPDGMVLSVWSAKSQDGTTCIAPMFEPPGELDRPAPTNFEIIGGQCAPDDLRHRAQAFGDSVSGSGLELRTMWASSGDAVRAELRLPDGTVRPTVHAAKLFFFWYFTNEGGDPPVLIGYDAAGNVVGEVPLRDRGKPVPTRTGG